MNIVKTSDSSYGFACGHSSTDSAPAFLASKLHDWGPTIYMGISYNMFKSLPTYLYMKSLVTNHHLQGYHLLHHILQNITLCITMILPIVSMNVFDNSTMRMLQGVPSSFQYRDIMMPMLTTFRRMLTWIILLTLWLVHLSYVFLSIDVSGVKNFTKQHVMVAKWWIQVQVLPPQSCSNSSPRV